MTDSATPQTQLRDLPDWRYLLQEYYELYRYLPSGGSTRIRAHQRHVREAIGRVLKANPVIATQPPAIKPVTAHLKRALDEGRGDRMGRLCQKRLSLVLSYLGRGAPIPPMHTAGLPKAMYVCPVPCPKTTKVSMFRGQ